MVPGGGTVANLAIGGWSRLSSRHGRQAARRSLASDPRERGAIAARSLPGSTSEEGAVARETGECRHGERHHHGAREGGMGAERRERRRRDGARSPRYERS